MKDASHIRWGDWIKRRQSFVGFTSQRKFAAKVGCSDDQLRKWQVLEQPPASMRKGFDERLAAALKIDRQTLFVKFRCIAPDAAPLWDGSNPDNGLRRRVQAMAELLPESALRKIDRLAERLVRRGIERSSHAA